MQLPTYAARLDLGEGRVAIVEGEPYVEADKSLAIENVDAYDERDASPIHLTDEEEQRAVAAILAKIREDAHGDC